MNATFSEACHRTRQQISLQLDCEGSEFENALVTAHLARCRGCSTFAEDLGAMTRALRDAPLAEPSGSFELPRRRGRIGLASAGSAVAAAVSVAGALIVGVGLHTSPSRISALDVQTARERISFKDEQLAVHDRTAVGLASQIPLGLEAAEGTTLDTSRGAD
jgi:predicted anti-sigma-YlaC factor YlaD